MIKSFIHLQKRFSIICIQLLIIIFFVQCKTNHQSYKHHLVIRQDKINLNQ